jgi:UDP-N-acetylglucosamine acyltransferase
MSPRTPNTISEGVHPTAIVAEGAELGERVQIGPGCVIGPRVRLGDGCRLHAHVVIDGDTHIGRECQIFPFAVLGTQPQDKKLSVDDPGGQLRIGDRNRIREHVTIHGGTPFGTGVTVLGDDNLMLVGSHVGHDAWIGSHVVFTNGAMAAGHCEIQDHVILGAMVGVHQFTRVGAYAMIGAGSMLSHDAPPFALTQGDRARLVGVNLVGLRRSGHSAEQSMLIKRVFRLLFWRDGVLSERMASARSFAAGNPLAQSVIDFVAASKRGVCATRGRLGPGDETTDDP